MIQRKTGSRSSSCTEAGVGSAVRFSAPIRRRVPLPHRRRNDTALGGTRSRDPFQERATLRSQLDPAQRFQRAYSHGLFYGLRELQKRIFAVECQQVQQDALGGLGWVCQARTWQLTTTISPKR